MQNRYLQNRKTKLSIASIRKHLVCESVSVNLSCFLKLMVWGFYRILEIHTLSSLWKGAVWVPNKDAWLGHLPQKEVTSLGRRKEARWCRQLKTWRRGRNCSGKRRGGASARQDTGWGGGLLPPPEDRRPRNTMAMNQGCHPHQGRRLELSRYFTFKKL